MAVLACQFGISTELAMNLVFACFFFCLHSYKRHKAKLLLQDIDRFKRDEEADGEQTDGSPDGEEVMNVRPNPLRLLLGQHWSHELDKRSRPLACDGLCVLLTNLPLVLPFLLASSSPKTPQYIEKACER